MDLKRYFDPYAMIAPKDERDILALLKEARDELRSINRHLERCLAQAPD